MKLGVIGSGNIGKSIGSWAAKVGNEVFFSAKNPGHARHRYIATSSHRYIIFLL